MIFASCAGRINKSRNDGRTRGTRILTTGQPFCHEDLGVVHGVGAVVIERGASGPRAFERDPADRVLIAGCDGGVEESERLGVERRFLGRAEVEAGIFGEIEAFETTLYPA